FLVSIRGVLPLTVRLSFLLVRSRGSSSSELLLLLDESEGSVSLTDSTSVSFSFCSGSSSVASSSAGVSPKTPLPVFVGFLFEVPAAVFVAAVVVTFPFDFLLFEVFFLYASNLPVVLARTSLALSAVIALIYSCSYSGS